MRRPQPFEFTNNDLDLAGLDWGGTGPTLMVLHPNGFCAGVYAPIAERLTDRFRVVGIDLPGHGASAVPDDDRRLGYDHAADDVVACLDHLGIDTAAICGVSLGAGVGLVTAQRHPERIEAVLACEAIAFPPAAVPADRFEVPNPMAAIALKRRRTWPDRATVRASYGSRPPLDVLVPEALHAYVEHGFVDLDDGTVELACPPEVEAAYFAMASLGFGPFEAFDALGAVQVPVTLVRGTDTNLPDSYFTAQAEQLEVPLHVAEGTHFFFFEAVERSVALVDAHLGGR